MDIYRARWLIEECNKALKTGCLIEHRQFESREALLNVIALSLPIAVEILALRSAARSTPDKPATDVMTPLRIELLRRLSARPLPDAAPVMTTVLSLKSLIADPFVRHSASVMRIEPNSTRN